MVNQSDWNKAEILSGLLPHMSEELSNPTTVVFVINDKTVTMERTLFNELSKLGDALEEEFAAHYGKILQEIEETVNE